MTSIHGSVKRAFLKIRLIILVQLTLPIRTCIMEALFSFVLPDSSEKSSNDKVRFIQNSRKTAKISANTRNLIFCPISAEKHGTILMFWSFFFPNQIPTFSREAKSDRPGRLFETGWNSSRPFQSQKLTGMTLYRSFGRQSHSSLFLQERLAKITQKRKAGREQMPWGIGKNQSRHARNIQPGKSIYFMALLMQAERILACIRRSFPFWIELNGKKNARDLVRTKLSFRLSLYRKDENRQFSLSLIIERCKWSEISTK